MVGQALGESGEENENGKMMMILVLPLTFQILENDINIKHS